MDSRVYWITRREQPELQTGQNIGQFPVDALAYCPKYPQFSECVFKIEAMMIGCFSCIIQAINISRGELTELTWKLLVRDCLLLSIPISRSRELFTLASCPSTLSSLLVELTDFMSDSDWNEVKGTLWLG